ncbi:MAG: M20 metallopeptidase family protein [Acidimicrobiales bacterium]
MRNASALAEELADLRHRLHREPEIGLRLPRTQEKVLSAIEDLPLEVSTGRALSSVTGVLRGGRPGPTVLLRGDMDALPLQEKVEGPFRSQLDGAMHACGHDLHTAMLVGAACLLSGRREELSGSVVFMFQPGEEGWDGAGAMIAEGVLQASGELPVAAYALHVMSSVWGRGAFVSRAGPMMAASDALRVEVLGTGGHGSAPQLARDPVPAACEMVTALQSLLTRTIDPAETAVVTVGTFHAGTARNVIPDRARFEATVRTFAPEVQERLATGSLRLCRGIAAAHGLEIEATFDNEYPLTSNSAEEVSLVAATVADVFDDGRFSELERPVTGSEDFSRVIERVPGAMVFLGAAPEGSDPLSAPFNHSAYASFDDSVLPDGAHLLAELARRRLGEAAETPTARGRGA